MEKKELIPWSENGCWEQIKQGGMDCCWEGWCKWKTALYSMETSPRHGQERSRKQRGLWINKFCELIVNASPKAPVNKTFTGGCFLHNCCLSDLTVPSLFVYVQNIFPLRIYSALLISSMWVPKITQKELCSRFCKNCKNKTINCQNPSHHNSQQRALFLLFPSLNPFCFLSAVEYTTAGKCYCVVLSLMLFRACPTPGITQGGHKWASFHRARRGLILPFWNAIIFWVCLISGIMEKPRVMHAIHHCNPHWSLGVGIPFNRAQNVLEGLLKEENKTRIIES